MADKKNSKEDYINAWDSHIKDFDTLAFCPKQEHSKKVQNAQEELRALVRQIAKTKDLK